LVIPGPPGRQLGGAPASAPVASVDIASALASATGGTAAVVAARRRHWAGDPASVAVVRVGPNVHAIAHALAEHSVLTKWATRAPIDLGLIAIAGHGRTAAAAFTDRSRGSARTNNTRGPAASRRRAGARACVTATRARTSRGRTRAQPRASGDRTQAAATRRTAATRAPPAADRRHRKPEAEAKDPSNEPTHAPKRHRSPSEYVTAAARARSHFALHECVKDIHSCGMARLGACGWAFSWVYGEQCLPRLVPSARRERTDDVRRRN
jgi:hypothetical protein